MPRARVVTQPHPPAHRIETLAETNVASRKRGHEDHMRVTPRRVEREQVRLTDRIVVRVDAQKWTSHIRYVVAARSVLVVMLNQEGDKTK